MTFTIRPAGVDGWLAFATGPRLLVTPARDDGFVDAAWAAIGSADGFRLALDLLACNGVAATPPFVLVEWIGAAEARIILRGTVPVELTDASGSEPLSAVGVSTWVERSATSVTRIQVSVPGVTPLGSAILPVESGVVLVAEVTFGAPGAAAILALESQPVPVPEQKHVSAPTPDTDPEATVRDAPQAATFLTEASVASPDDAQAEGYDYLFGDTLYRSVSDAVVPEPAPDEAMDSQIDDTLHDGETVLTSDIAKIRGKRRPAKKPETEPRPQQLVLAVSTTGAREPLQQPILVGRSPSVSKISGGVIPRLLTVGTPDQDISRNHVQVSLEGGTVVVTDLHSRNGTMVTLPGASPQKLRAGEPTSIIVGTVIDLGNGVTLTVEDTAGAGGS